MPLYWPCKGLQCNLSFITEVQLASLSCQCSSTKYCGANFVLRYDLCHGCTGISTHIFLSIVNCTVTPTVSNYCKVCLLTLRKLKRQTLPEINVYAHLFGTLEYTANVLYVVFTDICLRTKSTNKTKYFLQLKTCDQEKTMQCCFYMHLCVISENIFL